MWRLLRFIQCLNIQVQKPTQIAFICSRFATGAGPGSNHFARCDAFRNKDFLYAPGVIPVTWRKVRVNWTVEKPHRSATWINPNSGRSRSRLAVSIRTRIISSWGVRPNWAANCRSSQRRPTATWRSTSETEHGSHACSRINARASASAGSCTARILVLTRFTTPSGGKRITRSSADTFSPLSRRSSSAAAWKPMRV